MGNSNQIKEILDEIVGKQKVDYYDIFYHFKAMKYSASQHGYRTSYYVKKICDYLNLEDEERDQIEFAALVHDIGKISIPIEILNKPSKLDEDEWKIMKTHPQLGVNIINHFIQDAYVNQCVLHHHERWDGKGYPFGLKGENIPLGSRILSISDAIDAMTTNRIYKKSVTFLDSLTEIKNNSGSQFDPYLVEVIFDIFVKKVEYYENRLQKQWII